VKRPVAVVEYIRIALFVTDAVLMATEEFSGALR
jgi:hypothetical protein